MALLVYDGDCGFCRFWVNYWRLLTGDCVAYEPYQEAAARFPQIPIEEFRRASQLISEDGQVSSGALAVFRALASSPDHRWLHWSYEHVPGFGAAAEAVYRWIASHRSAAHRVTRLLWGKRLGPQTFHMAAWLFSKALAIIYLIAFVSLFVQIAGLVGAHGVLPVGEFLRSVQEAPWWRVPTVFWLGSSDLALRMVCVSGAVLAVAAVFELRIIRQIVFFLLFALYLSLVTAGQTFLSFQWDFLLLEAGFLAIFLKPCRARVWLFQWLLFRLMFLSGAVKWLSGDASWHQLTALQFHYETQPLPAPVAWYIHWLPPWFHKTSTALALIVETFVPFLIFAPRRPRHLAAYCFIGLQVLILVTGNYAFFNLLAIALCLFLLDDQWWRVAPPQVRQPGWRPATAAVFCFILLASCFEMARTFERGVPETAMRLFEFTAPFGIVNTYGLFAVMTTSRPEIIVEGSIDGAAWRAYEFRYKPGDLHRAPPLVAPHQPRLDWQMWFAALGGYQQNPWFVNFMLRLLQGSPEVTGLLAKDPFAGGHPRYVRAVLYDYHFAQQKWWRREQKGIYFPPVSLR